MRPVGSWPIASGRRSALRAASIQGEGRGRNPQGGSALREDSSTVAAHRHFSRLRLTCYSPAGELGSKWAFPDMIAFSKIDGYRWQDEYRFCFSITDPGETDFCQNNPVSVTTYPWS